jgi:hypothetical protein
MLSSPPLLYKKDELLNVKVELVIVKGAFARISPVAPETVKFTVENVLVEDVSVNVVLLIVMVVLLKLQLWQEKSFVIFMFPPEKEQALQLTSVALIVKVIPLEIVNLFELPSLTL